jgi:hypothetical protein
VLVRLLSASAVRIAFGIILTTPQPTASLDLAHASVERPVATVHLGRPAVTSQAETATPEEQDFALPGLGWG